MLCVVQQVADSVDLLRATHAGNTRRAQASNMRAARPLIREAAPNQPPIRFIELSFMQAEDATRVESTAHAHWE